jgi:hypothetical protein
MCDRVPWLGLGVSALGALGIQREISGFTSDDDNAIIIAEPTAHGERDNAIIIAEPMAHGEREHRHKGRESTVRN